LFARAAAFPPHPREVAAYTPVAEPCGHVLPLKNSFPLWSSFVRSSRLRAVAASQSAWPRREGSKRWSEGFGRELWRPTGGIRERWRHVLVGWARPLLTPFFFSFSFSFFLHHLLLWAVVLNFLKVVKVSPRKPYSLKHKVVVSTSPRLTALITMLLTCHLILTCQSKPMNML
jgi:hypothetical protein